MASGFAQEDTGLATLASPTRILSNSWLEKHNEIPRQCRCSITLKFCGHRLRPWVSLVVLSPLARW
eukprot:4339623-Amphidinium_carterae.1